MYIPHVVEGGPSELHADLTSLAPYMTKVEEGMRQAVTSAQGTARLLGDLPMAIAAKTGSAQVKNKTQENAFFVGYITGNKEQGEESPLVLLVLIENAREGSLNAVPIAKDVFAWYYQNRIAK